MALLDLIMSTTKIANGLIKHTIENNDDSLLRVIVNSEDH
jgi:hypothetical protein